MIMMAALRKAHVDTMYDGQAGVRNMTAGYTRKTWFTAQSWSIEEYELAQVGVATVMCIEEIAGQESLLVAQVEAAACAVPLSRKEQQAKEGSAVTVALDLNGSETLEELLDMIICRKAGINRDDIVLTWASPPCETFSRANWSNMSRGNRHRKKEDGLPPVEGKKGEKARAHDRLAVRIKEVLALTKRFVMENPAGGLERMWYMMDWQDKKKVIEMCAFAWPFKKI